jgi:hypothetical protein
VVTNIYSGDSGTGGGAPYTGLVGTLTTPGITFATDTSFNWHPFNLVAYGADSLATIDVATAGAYTFTLNSDDGSQAYIDGTLVVDDGGAHGPTTISNSVALTAGVHNLEVQFFECCGGDAGVDFTLPSGVTYGGGVPEPASWALMLAGFGALGAAIRSRRGLALAAD